MRRIVLTALMTMLICGGAAQAGTVAMVGDSKVEIDVVVKARIVADDTAYTQGKSGFYVFVASALPTGSLDLEAVENAAVCTNVRPQIGRTVPTDAGFKRVAYAAYYGPYSTRQDARDVQSAVLPCVTDAYVRAGVIQQ